MAEQLRQWQSQKKEVPPEASHPQSLFEDESKDLPLIEKLEDFTLATVGEPNFQARTKEGHIVNLRDRRPHRRDRRPQQEPVQVQVDFKLPDGTSLNALASEFDSQLISYNAVKIQKAQYWSTVANTLLTVVGAVVLGFGAVGIRSEMHKAP